MANSKKTKGKSEPAEKTQSDPVKVKSVNELTTNEKLFNDLLQEAMDNRQSSCFWLKSVSSDSENNGSTGGNWETQWDVQDNYAIMLFDEISQEEGYRANIKSPEIAGRLQSSMQKIAKINWGFSARALKDEARFQAQVADLLINNAFRKGKFKTVIKDAIFDALRHGSAPIIADFIWQTRDVTYPVTKADKMTDEEKTKFKTDKEIPKRKVKILDIRDVNLFNPRIQEIYVDPSARNMQGENYPAEYYFRVVMMPFRKFQRIYKNKPGYKNVDQVKPVSAFEEQVDDKSWFKPPKSITGDYVWLVEMRHFGDDLFMVRANNEWIKESELPNMDKKLNMVMLTPFKLPEQFYGIGLVDFLIPIVSAIEMLQNAVNDYVMYNANPAMIVEQSVYNEFSRHYRNARPGLMIPVKDINRAVAPLKYLPLSTDVFQVMASLQRDAVIASQQDPSQLGVVQKNATATANVINKEVTEAYINFVIDNITDDLNILAELVFSQIWQHLTEKDLYEVLDDEMNPKKVSEHRSIPIYGKKVTITPEDKGEPDESGKYDPDNFKPRSLEVVDEPGFTDYITIEPDLWKSMNAKGKEVIIRPQDLCIELTAESKEVMSKALRMQKSRENLAIIAPYMVDPNNRQSVAKHPMPLVNAVTYIEEFFEDNNISKRHLLNRPDMEKQDIQYAKDQNQAIMKQEFAYAEAGMSKKHVEVHVQFLQVLQKILKQKEDEVAALPMQQSPLLAGLPTDQPMQMPAPQPQVDPAVAQQTVETLKSVVQDLTDHVKTDSLPVTSGADNAIAQTAPLLMPPQMMMPQGMPQPGQGGMGGASMFGGMGNMGGGTPPMPNLPGAEGMTQGGGGQMGGIAPFAMQ